MFHPRSEGRERLRCEKGDLVVSLPAQRLQDGRDARGGVVLNRRDASQPRRHALAHVGQQPRRVDAQQRGEHEHLRAERAEPAADIHLGMEDGAEFQIRGLLVQRESRIGDRNELPPGGLTKLRLGLRPVIREVRVALGHPAGFRGEDEDRALQIQRDIDRVRPRRGRIQDVHPHPVGQHERRPLGARPERLQVRVDALRRPSHPHHDDVSDAVAREVLGELLERRQHRHHLIRQPQPAQPFGAILKCRPVALSPPEVVDRLRGWWSGDRQRLRSVWNPNVNVNPNGLGCGEACVEAAGIQPLRQPCGVVCMLDQLLD